MKLKPAKNITLFILEQLADIGSATFDAFFPRTYWHTRLSREFLGVDKTPRAVKQTISSILNRLKHEGLVIKTGRPKSVRWKITPKGEGYVKNLSLAVPEIPKQDGIMRLVIFDVPEEERYKRDILRAELVCNNFKMLQKSVWLGTNPLPEDFIHNLDNLGLKNKVHIFSVLKSGTIKLKRT